MRTRTVVLSLLFHAGLAASLLGVAAGRAGRHPIAVALSETKKKDKPKPKPPKPPPPVARPQIEHKVAALAKATVAPTVAAGAAPRAAVATALTMSNDDGPGGIALGPRAPVAAPTRVASAVTESRRQRMREALGPGPGGDAPCAEEPTRPEPLFKQDIEYTAQARADGIEGKLRLKFIVGADGSVADVVVVQGLSPEMDAAAVAAAKKWRFKPAMACGHPIAGATYNWGARFELGD